jgi:hypothetical protein
MCERLEGEVLVYNSVSNPLIDLFRLCQVQHMATKMYSSWYRGRNNSQIKSEAPEDDLNASKGIKRNQPDQPLKIPASKKVKLSETPPVRDCHLELLLGSFLL